MNTFKMQAFLRWIPKHQNEPKDQFKTFNATCYIHKINFTNFAKPRVESWMLSHSLSPRDLMIPMHENKQIVRWAIKISSAFMIQVNKIIALALWTQSIHILDATNSFTIHAKYQDDVQTH